MKEINFDHSQKWYDAEGLLKNKYPIYIINGVMDDGKTFGFKMYTFKKFLESGRKDRTIFVYNKEKTLKEDLVKFKSDMIEYEPEFRKLKSKTLNEMYVLYYDPREKENESFDFEDNIFAYLILISSATKTSRDANVKYMVYDEFNYLDTRIFNVQERHLQVLLSRNMRNLKFIALIGNAVSMNIPALNMLGIYQKPEKEFFEFKFGDMVGLFHNFKRNEEFLEEKYKDSIAYNIMKQTNFVKHAFGNEYILDDYSRIMPDVLTYLKWDKMKSEGICYITQTNIKVEILSLFFKQTKKILYFIRLSDKDVNVCIEEKYSTNGVEYNGNIPINLALFYQKNDIWFENITIKKNISEIIRNFISYW